MTIKPKSRLGRGLSSLISVSELSDSKSVPPPQSPANHEPSSSTAPEHHTQPPADTAGEGFEQIHQIPLDQIVPNPHQPRRQMNDVALGELAASLKSTGLIQPIVVRRHENHFQLIAGERRWRAAQLAGLAAVPAIVREAEAFAQAEMALVENVQRENLNPIDRALAYRTLSKQLGMTQADLAERLGEDRSTIANFLRLLDLPERVQAMVADLRLSHGHAKLIAGIPDIFEQEWLANLVIGQQLSVRNLEKLIQERGGGTPSAQKKDTPSAHLQDLEKNLSRQLGMRVQVRNAGKSKSRGKLIVHYADLDQFDTLISRLGITAE